MEQVKGLDVISERKKALQENRPTNYLDWDKLLLLVYEHDPENVMVGIGEDWFWTGGTILQDGKWKETDYGSYWCYSVWATPVAILEDSEGNQEEYPLVTHEQKYPMEVYTGENKKIIQEYKNMYEEGE